jgi:hypothetical protein
VELHRLTLRRKSGLNGFRAGICLWDGLDAKATWQRIAHEESRESQVYVARSNTRRGVFCTFPPRAVARSGLGVALVGLRPTE